MRRTGFSLIGCLILSAGCSKPKPAPAPPPPPATKPVENLIVLLPEGGRTGQITVSNAGGSQDLDQPYGAVRIASNTSAPSPFVMDRSEADRIFGPTLAVLPTAIANFTLLFEENSDQLTAESRALLPKIIDAIRERRSTDITVTGHTDTTDTSDANYRMGLRRAEGIAELLRGMGVERQNLFVASHGESDPAVKTADSVREPRNRRVEVIVR
jgi:outer membrane protein OmpA-like peptidoglycan-associated protein